MTDIENCSQCVEYIFQVSEKLPDGFYLRIMELLKEFHEHGTNLPQIHQFVESNKDILEPDIYNLFVRKRDGHEEMFHDFALVSKYETSVMMNKLFRNIKENENIDKIEESDDEDEFQNTSENKYVFLERSVKMRCEYNLKFKKWVPICVANADEPVAAFKQNIL
jgi:hypothetical protein